MCKQAQTLQSPTPPVFLLHEFPTSVEFNPGITHENTILLGTFKHCPCLHPTLRDLDSDFTGERPAKGCFSFNLPGGVNVKFGSALLLLAEPDCTMPPRSLGTAPGRHRPRRSSAIVAPIIRGGRPGGLGTMKGGAESAPTDSHTVKYLVMPPVPTLVAGNLPQWQYLHHTMAIGRCYIKAFCLVSQRTGLPAPYKLRDLARWRSQQRRHVFWSGVQPGAHVPAPKNRQGLPSVPGAGERRGGLGEDRGG